MIIFLRRLKQINLEEASVKTFEEEMTNDIISLITSYSARLYGRRGGKNKNKNND